MIIRGDEMNESSDMSYEMLRGNLVRLRLSKDEEELRCMRDFAIKRIDNIYRNSLDSLNDVTVDSKESPTTGQTDGHRF